MFKWYWISLLMNYLLIYFAHFSNGSNFLFDLKSSSSIRGIGLGGISWGCYPRWLFFSFHSASFFKKQNPDLFYVFIFSITFIHFLGLSDLQIMVKDLFYSKVIKKIAPMCLPSVFFFNWFNWLHFNLWSTIVYLFFLLFWPLILFPR